jgi:hypothetical protein
LAAAAGAAMMSTHTTGAQGVEQPIRSEQGARIVPLRTAAPPPPPVTELLVQAMRIAVGLAVLSTEALIEAVGRTLGSEPDAASELEPEEEPPPSGLPLVTGAALGVAFETMRWGARALETMARTAELMLGLSPRPAFVQQPFERAAGVAEGFDARWREQRPRDEEAATAFLHLLVPQIVDAVLDQVDLNEVVRSHIEVDRLIDDVDIGRVVERLDLDEIVGRVDLNAIVQRLDLNAVVDRLSIDEIADRIDVNRVVSKVDLDRVVSRIDLDAVAARLDVEAVVGRLDLGAIAQEVIDEIDLTAIIGEAMGSVTNETVGGIRVQSMNADRAISRLVDRILQRRTERDPDDSRAAGNRPSDGRDLP